MKALFIVGFALFNMVYILGGGNNWIAIAMSILIGIALVALYEPLEVETDD